MPEWLHVLWQRMEQYVMRCDTDTFIRVSKVLE